MWSFAASADVGFAVWDRYARADAVTPVGYTAHLMGALAGLTVGVIVLKNFEQKLIQQYIWWIAVAVYIGCTVFAICWNIFYYKWKDFTANCSNVLDVNREPNTVLKSREADIALYIESSWSLDKRTSHPVLDCREADTKSIIQSKNAGIKVFIELRELEANVKKNKGKLASKHLQMSRDSKLCTSYIFCIRIKGSARWTVLPTRKLRCRGEYNIS